MNLSENSSFLSIKMGEWDINILFFNYWNDFILG